MTSCNASALAQDLFVTNWIGCSVITDTSMRFEQLGVGARVGGSEGDIDGLSDGRLLGVLEGLELGLSEG